MSDVINITHEWEQAIKQIKSVIAARIYVNDQGEIAEIHILAGPDRAPKQIVRDVESTLAAQYNIPIDHKKISVAQMEEEEEENTALEESPRPKFVGVTLRTVNDMAEIKVELYIGGKIIEGIAHGPSTTYNKMRLFVEATLKALEPLTLDKYVFVTEDVLITQLAKHHIALVYITLIASAGEQSLVGCVLVKNDDREAVVKATLDAVNRKLRFLSNN